MYTSLGYRVIVTLVNFIFSSWRTYTLTEGEIIDPSANAITIKFFTVLLTTRVVSSLPPSPSHQDCQGKEFRDSRCSEACLGREEEGRKEESRSVKTLDVRDGRWTCNRTVSSERFFGECSWRV